MERILGFTDAKTHGKRWIFRTQNMGKSLQKAAFSVNSIFVFRSVNASFFCCDSSFALTLIVYLKYHNGTLLVDMILFFFIETR